MSTDAVVESAPPSPGVATADTGPAPETSHVDTAPAVEQPPAVDFSKYVERDHMTAALRELREKGRAERTQAQNELAQLRQQLDELRKPKAEPKANDDPMPDPETDPMAFVKWQHREAQRQQQNAERQRQADAQANQVTQQQAYVLHQYTVAAQEFMASEPTFAEAYGFIREHRARELAHFGVADIQGALRREEYQLAEAALANSRNPAQALFEAAKLRGWKPGGAAAEPTPPSPAATTPPRDPATGQFAKTPTREPPGSISKLPGGPGGQLTPEAVLAMSDSDLRKWGGGNLTEKWRQFAKGR